MGAEGLVKRSTRRWLVPEALQTSSMDCGVTALRALLEGHGLRVNHARLREACQTTLDGTSFDTVEDVTNQLGLEAEQVVIPVDHFLEPAARCLPSLLFLQLPSGMTHIVVCWRRHGPLHQLMDPGRGRM